MKRAERSQFYRNRALEIKKLNQDGNSKAEIGRMYGISREKIRQIINWVNDNFDHNYGKRRNKTTV